MSHDVDWSAISAELQKPLDRKHVKPAKKFGPKGDYIEAWHAQAEANRIFGHGGWTQEIVALDCVNQSERGVGKDQAPGWGVTYTARVRITVGTMTREDVGAGHGVDKDVGLAHESAIKEAVSDAIKRALKSFGYPFGLALYDKTQEHVADVSAQEEQERRAHAVLEHINQVRNCATVDELTDAWKAIARQWGGGANVPPEIINEAKQMKAQMQGSTS